MARIPTPIRPRVKDAKLYEKAVRASFLDPMFAAVQARLANVVAVNQVWAVMDDIVGTLAARPHGGVPIKLIQEAIGRVEGWHRMRLIRSFRAALGVNIVPYLTQPAVQSFMQQKVTENVNLITRLPDRARESLRNRLAKELQEAPFDRQMVQAAVRQEIRVSKGRLRLITQDQVGKQVGQLTQLRQQELGITRFRWDSSDDERVRPAHVRRDGVVYEWSDPPEGEIPGVPIRCRCVAGAVIDSATRRKFTGSG